MTSKNNLPKYISAVIIIGTLILFFLLQEGKINSGRPDLLRKVTAKDPLFYISGTNLEKLQENIFLLKSKQEEFKKFLISQYNEKGGTARERLSPAAFEAYEFYYGNILPEPNYEILYPVNFLKILPVISRDTDAFLGKGDFRSAFKLIADYREAARAYKESIRTQLETIESLRSHQALLQSEYIYVATALNPKIMESDLRIVGKNAEALENEVNKREKCFLTGECPAPSQGNPLPVLSSGQAPKIGPLIPDNLLQVNGVKAEKLGPYTVRTVCFGNEFNDSAKTLHRMYILLERVPNLNGGIIFTPKLVDENYYFDLTFNHDDFGRILKKNGVDFYFQPDGANYLCNDLTYWPELSYEASGNQFVYLPEMINTLTNSLITYETEVMLGKYPPFPDLLMAFFSNYSLTYFPFSERFWRIKEQPQYMEKVAMRPKAYKTYSELRNLYSTEAIAKFHFRPSDIRRAIMNGTLK